MILVANPLLKFAYRFPEVLDGGFGADDVCPGLLGTGRIVLVMELRWAVERYRDAFRGQ